MDGKLYTNPDPLCPKCGKQFCDHKGNIPDIARQLTEMPFSKPADPEAWEKTRQFLMDLVDARR